jgi:hypothetical protein
MLFGFLKISLLTFKLNVAVENFLVALTNWKLVLEEEKKKRR